jgi:amino acid transporter
LLLVGGGIFSTLGVVVGIAGAWAWLSFAAAGLIALAAGYSYVKLSVHYGEGGGAFTFFREINAEGFAGSLSWVLIVGYVLTNAVYAFTFGEYLGYVVGFGPWFPRMAGVAIVALFIGLNLRGVGEAGGIEMFLVWFKLAVLVGLAGWGLVQWDPSMLSRGVPDAGISAALFGAASVFMAYEGFQLLAYDYQGHRYSAEDAAPRGVVGDRRCNRCLHQRCPWYGHADRSGPGGAVQGGRTGHRGTAGVRNCWRRCRHDCRGGFHRVGHQRYAFCHSTSRVQGGQGGELPATLDHKNTKGIPDRAVVELGTAAAVLAAVGTLTTLVEAASLAFLFTFAVVCGLAFHQRAGVRPVTGFGALAATTASVALVVRLIRTEPLALVFLGLLVLIALFGRPVLLRHVKTESRRS